MELHNVRRAACPQGAAVEPMGVGHRGADVLAPLQQMGGKRMAEAMARPWRIAIFSYPA
jgi:hypothetical protein